jgi:hypothetical protein
MPLKRWKALHRETIVACLLEQPAIEPLPSYWELAALAVAPGRQPAGELECVTSVGQAVWRLLAHWNQPPRVGDWISVRDLAALCGKRQGVIRNALRRGDLQGFRRRPLSAALGVHWAQAIWYADDATATKVIMTQIVNRYYGWSSEATQQQISDALIAAITPRLAAPAPRW